MSAREARDEDISYLKRTLEKKKMKNGVNIITGGQFPEAVAQMTETIKDETLSERLERYQKREIFNESLKKRNGHEISDEKPSIKEDEKRHEEEMISFPELKTNNETIIKMTRSQFKQAVIKMAETIKDIKLPKKLRRYQEREIFNESLKKRAGCVWGFMKKPSISDANQKSGTNKNFIKKENSEEDIKKQFSSLLKTIHSDNFARTGYEILQITAQKNWTKNLDKYQILAEQMIESILQIQNGNSRFYVGFSRFLQNSEKVENPLSLQNNRRRFKYHLMVHIHEFLMENTRGDISLKGDLNNIQQSLQMERLLVFMGQLYKKKVFDIYDIHLAIVTLLRGFVFEYKQSLQHDERNDYKFYEISLKGLGSLCKFLVEFHWKKMRTIQKPIEHSHFVRSFSETIKNINSNAPTQGSGVKISNLTCNSIVDLLDEMLEIFEIIVLEVKLDQTLKIPLEELIKKRYY